MKNIAAVVKYHFVSTCVTAGGGIEEDLAKTFGAF